VKKEKVFLAVITLLSAALACNLPNTTKKEITPLPATETITETSSLIMEPTENLITEEPPFTCSKYMTPGSAFGVEFCFPTAIASGFSQAIIPEKPSNLDAAPWDFNPDTIEVVLTDYPVDNLYYAPTVLIYPVEDYKALGENIETIVINLETLLADQPPNPDAVPFLPIANAAQMMQAKVSYLDFRNGSGVRFITQYGQGAAPISNDSAVYSYMGITDNGQYLISVTFPITHDLFYPDVLTEPEEGWMSFAENFTSYINNMETALSIQPPESFTPNIQLLDEMMASFLIPTAAIP
jgi:hypothetical protein